MEPMTRQRSSHSLLQERPLQDEHLPNALLQDEEGLSTVEYVIILILIAIVAIVAWQNFGQAVENKSRQATGSINGLP